MKDLKNVDQHFAFGKNWFSFLETVDETSIAKAKEGLTELIPPTALDKATFLDIGCGSGLSTLAAIESGVNNVLAIDIDPDSIHATKKLLHKMGLEQNVDVQLKSIFDLRTDDVGAFDIVYSWGVLHHSGDMWTAIRIASSMVADNGLFVLAIYTRTHCCTAWKYIKRFYSKSPQFIQKLCRGIYKLLFYSKLLCTGKSPLQYIRNYSQRGMNFHIDVHDWIGGYPYESATPEEILSFMNQLDFKPINILRLRFVLAFLAPAVPNMFFKNVASFA